MPSGWKFWPEKPPGPVDDAFVQKNWVRPYRPGPFRVAMALIVFAVTVYATFAGVIAVLTTPTGLGRSIALVITVAIAGSLAMLGSRIMATGVWVNDFGVRIYGLVRSERIAWDAITDVRRVRGPTRVLGSPLRGAGDTVWIVLLDGSDRETPVTSRGPDFLGRAEAYDMAAGAVERWFEETRPAGS